MTERYEALERLSVLRDNGTLTPEEFQSEKLRIIGVSLREDGVTQKQGSTSWLRSALTSDMSKSVVLGALLGAIIAGPIPLFDVQTGAAIGAAIGAWRKI